VIALVVALVLLVASLLAVPWIDRAVNSSLTGASGVAGAGPGWAGARAGRGGPMGDGPGMGPGIGAGMGRASGMVWLAGDGAAVTTIAAARGRAQLAAAPSGLRPGEIIQFSDNFYVELKDSAGAAVTEVLVDPTSGAVRTEPGPAMMWNTGSRAAAVSADQARSIAARWLATNRPSEKVASIDAYPGYYTVDTAIGAATAGMLSVNATTGAVWLHTWHGAFVAKEDS
jgi:hypothetical protein